MIELRPQQVFFEEEIRKLYRAGHRKVVAVASTGFGKGVVIADMAAKAGALERDTLIVTNRRQIVTQLLEHCDNNDVHAGVIMGDAERDESAMVQVASIQTLKKRGFDCVSPRFIILDECHQENATYSALMNDAFPDVPVLGLTATPVAKGGARLSHFDCVIEPVKNSEVLREGWLLKVKYLAPYQPDMNGINVNKASQETIGGRVDECTIYADVFRVWEPFKHMQTLVVTQTRAIANTMVDLATERGIKAVAVDGTTSSLQRKIHFANFQTLGVQWIVGVDVIREGLDLTAAQCLIDLQVNHQFRAYWQKIGRVKRIHPGQEYAVVIDVVGNLDRHLVHPDHDPPWNALARGDVTIEEAIKRKNGKACPKCGSADYIGPVNDLYKCEDCGESWAANTPWVCPHCSEAMAPWQKRIEGKCPNCGETVTTRPTKRIRFGDGQIKAVPAHEVKKRKKKKADSEQQCWTKWLYIARGWNAKTENRKKAKKTINWCRFMYQREMGHWPATTLKPYPEDDSDLKRAPEAVFPWLKSKKKG